MDSGENVFVLYLTYGQLWPPGKMIVIKDYNSRNNWKGKKEQEE